MCVCRYEHRRLGEIDSELRLTGLSPGHMVGDV